MSQNFVVKSLFVFFLCFSGIVSADDNLYFFVFKEGIAQENIRVKVGENEAITDEFGFANFSLPAGFYEVSYFEGDEIFAITDIDLFENLQSQIFLNLYRTGAQVDLDIPLAEYAQYFSVEEIQTLDGPKGRFQLTIRNSRDNSVVTGAKLFFRGYNLEAISNEEGIVDIEIAEGTYDISVIHPNYVLNIIKDITITREETTEVVVNLTESDFVLEDYVVTAPFVEGSLASTIAEMKDSDVVADTISSEQISKSGDSSAASALRRVTGVTIIDDKFVCIRGLCEQYVTVLANGMQIPSSDPTKRIIPLDIFPASVVDNLQIQKTYSSELPGTFAGGTVLIDTQGIPKEDNYISGSVGAILGSYTGKTAQYSPDNSVGVPDILLDLSDDFGVLTQGIPSLGVPGLTLEEKSQLNQTMVNYRSFGVEEKTIAPGSSISFDSGQRFKTSNGIEYGFTASVFFKAEEELIESRINREFQFDEEKSIAQTNENNYNFYEYNENFGGLLGFGFDPFDNLSFKYTFLNVDKSKDITQVGFEEDFLEDDERERTYLSFVEESLSVHQLAGEYQLGRDKGSLFDDVEISWGIQQGTATRLEPGTFEYEYQDGALDELEIDEKSLFILYSYLEDELDNNRIDIALPFELNGNDSYLNLGYFAYTKTRNLDNRRFKFEYDVTSGDTSPIDEVISEENVNNGTLEVLDAYKPDDFYTAEEDLSALYISSYLDFEVFDVSLGVRDESSTQSLLVGQEEDSYILETDDLLPAILFSYNFADDARVRIGYSETLSRPDFREFSPNRYKDTLTNNIVFGFPELKATNIQNYDLSYEWFPSFDEQYKISVFYKKFTNPIEKVRTKADEDIEVSYRNALEADNYGIEFGFRENLGNNFYLDSNIAWIDSSITLDEDSTDVFISDLTSNERPMQGQSPYVINVALGYDNFFTKRSAYILYNVFGERITELGILGDPDVYEAPYQSLDLVVKWRINDTYDEQRKKIAYGINFKATNLLDESVKYNQGNETIFEYKKGQTYNLQFSMGY